MVLPSRGFPCVHTIALPSARCKSSSKKTYDRARRGTCQRAAVGYIPRRHLGRPNFKFHFDLLPGNLFPMLHIEVGSDTHIPFVSTKISLWFGSIRQGNLSSVTSSFGDQSFKEIHVSTAQRYASAAFRDGLTEDTIRDIASLACWGKHQQNVERDLHRWMPHAHDSQLKPHSTSIEVYNPDTAKIEQLEIPILLASDVLHSLWMKQDPKLWDECVGATRDTCREFWDYAESEWATDHPVIQPSGCILWYGQ